MTDEDPDLVTLRERLAIQSDTVEWMWLLELNDVLDYVETKGVKLAALRSFYETNVDTMHKAQAGTNALDPLQVQMRGGAAGGVMWLLDQGEDLVAARTMIATAMKMNRNEIVSWHKAALKAPDISDQRYRLNLNFAAQKMKRMLAETYNRKHNQMSVQDFILEMFAPVPQTRLPTSTAL
jgi:hypothetical protein